MTDKTMYESLKTETFLACAAGRAAMTGSKTFLAHDVWQTMEHSSGVTLMLRKPC